MIYNITITTQSTHNHSQLTAKQTHKSKSFLYLLDIY